MATSIKPYFLVRRERSFIGVAKNSARRVRFLPAQRKIVERFLSDHPDITKVSQLSGENEEALQRRIGNSPNLHSLARKILADFSRLRVGCRIGAYAWVFDTDAETVRSSSSLAHSPRPRLSLSLSIYLSTFHRWTDRGALVVPIFWGELRNSSVLGHHRADH